MMIQFDLKDFVNRAKNIPRFEKSSTEQAQKFEHETLVKFLCVHLGILEEQLSKRDVGHQGAFYLSAEVDRKE